MAPGTLGVRSIDTRLRLCVRHITAAVFLLCTAAACDAPESVEQPPQLATGYWQANIALPGGNIESGIELSRAGEVYTASLVNGRERVPINEVSFSDGELLLRFPAFNNEIRATLVDGQLSGTLTLVKRYGDTQVMPFTATPGNPPPAESATAPKHDLSGRWAVRFHEPDGGESPSIGEFRQRGARLFGTFLNPNADHRFLAGHVRGDNFHLSTFDGAHAFIFSGTVNDGGEIVDADFWSGTSWHQKWSAVRNDTVELPDAYARTYLKPGYERFEFEFPDQLGNTCFFCGREVRRQGRAGHDFRHLVPELQ